MNMAEKAAGNQAFVILEGAMYIEEAVGFREKMMEHLQNGRSQFEIDMTKLDYIDSSGLRALVALQKRAFEHNGGVVLRGLNGAIRELFELTRLNKIFEILP